MTYPADHTTRLITTDEWLSTYASLGWDDPAHHMHAAYLELAAESTRTDRTRS